MSKSQQNQESGGNSNYYYCLFGTDKITNFTGAFIYNGSRKDLAVSPVFKNHLDLFKWAKNSGFEFNPYDKDISICYEPLRMKKVIKNLYPDKDGKMTYELSKVKFHPPATFTDAEIALAKQVYLGKSQPKQEEKVEEDNIHPDIEFVKK